MSEVPAPLVDDTPTLEFIPSDYTYCPDHDAVFLAFMSLMPRGTAWDNVDTTTNRSSVIRQFISAISLSWLHFEEAMCVSLDEWICKTSDEDLDMWALEYGVPDECDIYNQNLCAKVSATGSATAEYLNSLLEASGYAVEGRWLTGTDPEYPGVLSTFHVMIDPATSAALTERPILNFLLGTGIRLGDVGGNTIEDLTCMLERYVPAHCVVEVNVAGEFHPLALGSKLKAWWNADTTVNGSVTNWLDTISSYAASGASFTRPISQLIEDKRYVTFDGEDDYLRTPKIIVHPSGDGVSEIFALFDYTVRGGGASLITAETNALGIDFLADDAGKRIAVKSGGVITTWALNDFIKQLSGVPKLLTDKSGNLSYTPHNSQQYSDNIASGALWSFSGTTAPTATFLRPTATNQAHTMGFNATPHTNGEIYTYSGIYAEGGYSKVAWGVGTSYVVFDLLTAEVLETFVGTYPIISYSITSLGDGRCYLTYTYLSAGGSYAPMPVRILPDSWTPGTSLVASWLADGTKGINIYRSQENRGPFPTAYLRTTTLGVYGIALEYDPLTRKSRGLLAEPAGGNGLFWSKDFDNALWVKTGCTVTPNVALSPMNFMDMDKLVESAGAGPHELSYTINPGVSRISLYVRAGERTQIMLANIQATITAYGFDLSTGTMFPVPGITTAALPTIALVGDDLYRISITVTGAVTGIKITLLNGGTNLYTGDGTSGLYIWGAQTEGSVAAPVPSSYSPTYGAAATRVADNYQIALSQIPALGPVYSVYHKFSSPVTPPNARASMILNDNTANEYVAWFNATTTTQTMFIRDNAVNLMSTVSGTGTIVANSPCAIAARVKVNDSAFSVAGGAALVDTDVPSLPTLTQITFANNGAGGALAAFRYSEIVIACDRGWDDATLQSKTTILYDSTYWEANDDTLWATGDTMHWELEM